MVNAISAHGVSNLEYVKPNKYFAYMHWLEGSGRPLNLDAADIEWKLDKKKLENHAWGSQVEIRNVGAHAEGDAKDHVGGVSGHFSGVISEISAVFFVPKGHSSRIEIGIILIMF